MRLPYVLIRQFLVCAEYNFDLHCIKTLFKIYKKIRRVITFYKNYINLKLLNINILKKNQKNDIIKIKV